MRRKHFVRPPRAEVALAILEKKFTTKLEKEGSHRKPYKLNIRGRKFTRRRSGVRVNVCLFLRLFLCFFVCLFVCFFVCLFVCLL